VSEFHDDAREDGDRVPQGEQDIDDIIELGRGHFENGAAGFVAALLDGFNGTLTDEDIMRRLAVAGHGYAKRCTWEHDCASWPGAMEWARRIFEREQRKRIEAEFNGTNGATEAGGCRFRFIDDEELENQPPVRWQVKDILPAGALAALVGPTDRFKSFAAYDLAASVQTGQQFVERYQTEQGQTLYIIGEGRGQFGRRSRAWKAHRGIKDRIGMKFLPVAVQFMESLETSLLLDTIERSMPDPPTLVVVDTVARSMVGGEENSAKDMGLFIAGADRIRHATGATVLLIHHAGKDGKTRGSSALPGALDVHMLADADGDFVTITCDKMKDAERFAPMTLRRRVIQFEDGTSSLVLVPVDDAEARPRGVGDLPDSVRTLLKALKTDPCRATDLLKKTGLANRTFYFAIDKAKGWNLIALVSDYYRLTPEGEKFNA
jgi:hypothetical protein